MLDVRVNKTNLFGEWLYRVYVHDERYDKFFSKTEFTDSELYDVAQGYQEALDAINYSVLD